MVLVVWRFSCLYISCSFLYILSLPLNPTWLRESPKIDDEARSALSRRRVPILSKEQVFVQSSRRFASDSFEIIRRNTSIFYTISRRIDWNINHQSVLIFKCSLKDNTLEGKKETEQNRVTYRGEYRNRSSVL